MWSIPPGTQDIPGSKITLIPRRLILITSAPRGGLPIAGRCWHSPCSLFFEIDVIGSATEEDSWGLYFSSFWCC
jgi:hypothetical protein